MDEPEFARSRTFSTEIGRPASATRSYTLKVGVTLLGHHLI